MQVIRERMGSQDSYAESSKLYQKLFSKVDQRLRSGQIKKLFDVWEQDDTKLGIDCTFEIVLIQEHST